MTKASYRWMLAGILMVIIISAVVYYLYFFEPEVIITEGTLVMNENIYKKMSELLWI